ncbi:MAG: glucose/galactose MFS transporter [Porticoccaceae bacterium]|nr:glucose/galactose MFS transporter [Porticoccaceae bacterium]|tara:strand:- start:863 stop:2146 length:1284 start_codon:yes stop_codon:yes gene_type:complete
MMGYLQRYISGLRNNGLIWILVPGIFFCWGFTSTSIDMVIPRIKSMFDLSYTSALLIQFSFFLAYLFIPIPAGKFIQYYGYRQSLFIGLACTALGVFLLAPSVILQFYPAFLGGIFITATGIAMLQVTANPMILSLGDPLTAPRRLMFAQAFNSLGTTIAPLIASISLLSIDTLSTHQINLLSWQDQATYHQDSAHATISFAILLGSLLGILALTIKALPQPNLQLTKKGQTSGETVVSSYFSLLKRRKVYLGMGAIFVYVGAEVTIGSLLINYMRREDVLAVEASDASALVAIYWGLAMLGRFAGVVALKWFSAEKILRLASAMAIFLVAIAIIFTGPLSAVALISVGFFNSAHFPLIFSTTLRGSDSSTPKISALLCMSICGGAIITLIAGSLADIAGLKAAFLVCLFCYGYCLYFSYYHRSQMQ